MGIRVAGVWGKGEGNGETLLWGCCRMSTHYNKKVFRSVPFPPRRCCIPRSPIRQRSHGVRRGVRGLLLLIPMWWRIPMRMRRNMALGSVRQGIHVAVRLRCAAHPLARFRTASALQNIAFFDQTVGEILNTLGHSLRLCGQFFPLRLPRTSLVTGERVRAGQECRTTKYRVHL